MKTRKEKRPPGRASPKDRMRCVASSAPRMPTPSTRRSNSFQYTNQDPVPSSVSAEVSRRVVRGLLLSAAIAGCTSTPAQVLERDVLREHKPPLPGAVRAARLKEPKRPRTVAGIDFDVRALPALEVVELDDLEPGAGSLHWRNGSELVFTGLEGVDLESGRDRWFAEKRSRPTGTRRFDGSSSSFVVWRGPATVDDAGRLEFFCFEGELHDETAKASSAYRVAAEPIVPGVLWGFRSGRPDAPSSRAIAGRNGRDILAPEPCVGVERVEFIGPPAFSIVQSSMDPRDAIALTCERDGGCAFARVAVPLEAGELSSALLLSADRSQLERLVSGFMPPNLTKFGGAPPDTRVFEYTMELDCTRPGEGPVGHVFIAASSDPVLELAPSELARRF